MLKGGIIKEIFKKMKKNSLYKAHRRTKMPSVILSIVFFILLIPTINAFDWDNSYRYDKETKTATIENMFGLGADIANLTLVTPQVMPVFRGKDRLVGAFKVTLFESEYDNPLKEMYFYNLKNDLQQIDKQFTFKYLKRTTKTETIPQIDCDRETLECVQVGSYEITRTNDEWIPITKAALDKYSGGTKVVGIFTDVEAGEFVEWIPNFFGNKIKEWASWNETFNDSIGIVWKFEESSGAFVDTIGGDDNLTNTATIEYQSSGKQNYGAGFIAGNDYGTLTDSPRISGQNLTINFWINNSVINGLDFVYDKGQQGTAGQIEFAYYANVVGCGGTDDAGTYDDAIYTYTIPTHLYQMVTCVYNSTGIHTYYNGTYQASDTSGGTYSFDNAASLEVGRYSSGAHYHEGGLDEFYVWNRQLSPEEIASLWDSGTGTFYAGFGGGGDTPPSVNLTIPADNYNSTSSSITFNATSTDDNGVVNITLWIDGAVNQTFYNTSASQNLSFQVTKSLTDGVHTWGAIVYDELGQQGSTSNRTLEIDATRPTLTQASNLSTFTTTTFPYTWNLNYTASDAKLSTCWYWTSDNSTNTTFTCNTSTPIVFGAAGTKTIYYFANDTYGNFGNRNDSISLISHDYTQAADPTTSLQGQTIRFNLSINFSFNIESFNATLVFNNTEYQNEYITNTTTWVLTNVSIIPSANLSGAFNWWWNYTINGSQYLTASQSYTISTSEIVICGDSTNTTTLNFTIRDENNDTLVNTSTFETTFTFWTDDPTNTQNYSYSNLSGATFQYLFCINPNNATFYADLDAEYSGTGYNDRTYYLRNTTLTNNTQFITLYLLHDDQDQKFFIDVKQGTQEVEFGRVLIKKYFVGSGVYKTIGVRITDEDGEFIEYLELDKSYEFTIIDSDGNVLGTIEKTASCQAAPCTMSLNVQQASQSVYSQYYGVFGDGVVYNLSYNDTNKLVRFEYIDTTGLASYARLVVEQLTFNESNYVVCDTTLSSVSGTIYCNMTNFTDGDFKATTFISRSPELIIDFITFVISSLKDSLGLTGLLISVVLIITIFFAFAFDVAIGIISVPLSLSILKMSQILPLSWTPIAIFWVIAVFLAYKVRV